MSESYLFGFKNKKKKKNFQLDIWKIKNFIKTQTSRHLEDTTSRCACELIAKYISEECLE